MLHKIAELLNLSELITSLAIAFLTALAAFLWRYFRRLARPRPPQAMTMHLETCRILPAQPQSLHIQIRNTGPEPLFLDDLFLTFYRFAFLRHPLFPFARFRLRNHLTSSPSHTDAPHLFCPIHPLPIYFLSGDHPLLPGQSAAFAVRLDTLFNNNNPAYLHPAPNHTPRRFYCLAQARFQNGRHAAAPLLALNAKP